MGLLHRNINIWWQKPRSIGTREPSREISFLELFYDLVFVAIVIQLTHTVAGHVSVESVLSYGALFAMVWWAWVNGTMYHELHGNHDIRTRLFTFVQMAALGGMAIFIPTAFGSGYQGFAGMYALFLGIITYLWWRSGVHDPRHRPLSRSYVYGFCATTIVFAVSAWMPFDVAWMMWVVGVVFSLVLPVVITLYGLGQVDDQHRETAQSISPAVVERIGLLVMIVLGESIISLVRGSGHMQTLYLVDILMVGGLFGVIVALWWIYFDFIARRMPVQKTGERMGWLYIHLPLMLGVGLTSAGILHMVEYAQGFGVVAKWMFVGPLVLFLVSAHLIMRVLEKHTEYEWVYQAGRRSLLYAAGLLVVVGCLDFGRSVTVALVLVTLLYPVGTAFMTWIRIREQINNTQQDEDKR